MANYVTNIVCFYGNEQQVEKLRNTVQDDEYGWPGIDFNKIIPMPSGLFMGGINPDTRAQYGKNNWLDWSVANWGTKWNAFQFENDPEKCADDRILFVTANRAPHPVLQKLSEMFPDITMHHQWADENVGYNCGERTYKGGQILDAYYPDYGKRAVEYACQVMGTLPSDHCLKLSEDGTEYVCAEEDEEMEVEMRL